ncbi:phosphate ABC transporter substrate-binding protein [Vibrio genomosp. F10]|uniref:phosphate ABC transporter substrate-binding protein n=1 Tax=Vibrio genomosp. F10 TaxID=723171 RepID=UPI0002E03FD0|nr:phosphate ABC transporter substrate-binding protein [Vibrio genomosp. F10]OEF04484.1 phosphate ABC transporter substrate-binding protein [Vibrio genomosp. F10 str. 9ZB36]
MFRIALAALLSITFLPNITHANEVNISGSTSVARIMDVLAEEFNRTNPDSFIAVQGVGSTAGLTLLDKGAIEIGMSSRYLTEGEQNEDLTVLPIAFDGLAVVVNNANSIENITREQLYDIYKGNVTNWKSLGGADQEIAVVTREASSGTRYSFESLLGLTKIVNKRLVSDISSNNLVVNSNSMVKTIVNHNKQAIGFISVGSVDKSVKALQFEGSRPTSNNIALGKYALSRPFLVVYHQETVSDQGRGFLNYIKTEAAKSLIKEYGYTPVK